MHKHDLHKKHGSAGGGTRGGRRGPDAPASRNAGRGGGPRGGNNESQPGGGNESGKGSVKAISSGDPGAAFSSSKALYFDSKTAAEVAAMRYAASAEPQPATAVMFNGDCNTLPVRPAVSQPEGSRFDSSGDATEEHSLITDPLPIPGNIPPLLSDASTTFYSRAPPPAGSSSNSLVGLGLENIALQGVPTLVDSIAIGALPGPSSLDNSKSIKILERGPMGPGSLPVPSGMIHEAPEFSNNIPRRGHRNKTLSLNPEEREALENLVEEVLIGGFEEAVLDSDNSSSDDDCDRSNHEQSSPVHNGARQEYQARGRGGSRGMGRDMRGRGAHVGPRENNSRERPFNRENRDYNRNGVNSRNVSNNNNNNYKDLGGARDFNRRKDNGRMKENRSRSSDFRQNSSATKSGEFSGDVEFRKSGDISAGDRSSGDFQTSGSSPKRFSDGSWHTNFHAGGGDARGVSSTDNRNSGEFKAGANGSRSGETNSNLTSPSSALDDRVRGVNIYPAQLKVAIKHMDSLPPRFLRRLQTGGGKGIADVLQQRMLQEAANKEIAAAAAAKNTNSVNTMNSPPSSAEKDKSVGGSGGKSKNLQLQEETKKSFRNLLGDLDQYTDEGLNTLVVKDSVAGFGPPAMGGPLHGPFMSSQPTDGSIPPAAAASFLGIPDREAMKNIPPPSLLFQPGMGRGGDPGRQRVLSCEQLEKEMLLSSGLGGAGPGTSPVPAGPLVRPGYPGNGMGMPGHPIPQNRFFPGVPIRSPNMYMPGQSQEILQSPDANTRKTQFSVNAPEFVSNRNTPVPVFPPGGMPPALRPQVGSLSPYGSGNQNGMPMPGAGFHNLSPGIRSPEFINNSGGMPYNMPSYNQVMTSGSFVTPPQAGPYPGFQPGMVVSTAGGPVYPSEQLPYMAGGRFPGEGMAGGFVPPPGSAGGNWMNPSVSRMQQQQLSMMGQQQRLAMTPQQQMVDASQSHHQVMSADQPQQLVGQGMRQMMGPSGEMDSGMWYPQYSSQYEGEWEGGYMEGGQVAVLSYEMGRDRVMRLIEQGCFIMALLVSSMEEEADGSSKLSIVSELQCNSCGLQVISARNGLTIPNHDSSGKLKEFIYRQACEAVKLRKNPIIVDFVAVEEGDIDGFYELGRMNGYVVEMIDTSARYVQYSEADMSGQGHQYEGYVAQHSGGPLYMNSGGYPITASDSGYLTESYALPNDAYPSPAPVMYDSGVMPVTATSEISVTGAEQSVTTHEAS